MRPLSPAAVGRLALAVLAGAAGNARADSSPGGSRAVVVYVDGDASHEARRTAILTAIRAQLVDLKVSLQVESPNGVAEVRRAMRPAPSTDGADAKRLGSLWLDLTDPADVLVFIANADGTHGLIRRIRRADAREDAAYEEEVAVVVRSTVNGLLDGLEIGMAPRRALPDAAPAPVSSSPPSATPTAGTAALLPPPPVAVASPAPAVRSPLPVKAVDAQPSIVQPSIVQPSTVQPRRGAMLASISYVGTVFSSPGSWQNGVSFAARYVAPFQGYVGAAYDFLPSSAVSGAGLELELERHPATVTAGYQAAPASSLRIDGELALVIDAVTRTTTSSATPSFQPAPGATKVMLAASPRTRLAFSPVRHLSLSAGGGADVVLNHFSYVVAPGTTSPVVNPLAVRPRVEVGLELRLP